MKCYILLILFFQNIFVFSQNKNTIVFNFLDCRYNDENAKNLNYANEFKLYRNDSLCKIVSPRTSFNVLSELKDGKYYFEYATFYEFVKRKELVLQNDVTLNLDLCINEINYVEKIKDHLPFIDRMNDNEELIISYSSQGCFAPIVKEKIVIKKIADDFLMIYNGKQRNITNKEVSFFREFEIELLNLKEGHIVSTSQAYNEIIYNNSKISYNERYKFWNGFAFLKKQLHLGF